MEYKQDIFWDNFLYTKGQIYRNLGFLKISLGEKSFLKNKTDPYFIWTGTGKIKKLEKKILDSKILNKLKDREVHFYLYEPLCARIGDSFNKSFYSEFDSTENLKDMVADEFESIRIFVKNNNITNFRIFTSDYNIQLIQENYPDLKISCLDLFLRDVATGYETINTKEKNVFSKKFWCGNWRYTTHRHVVTSYVSTFNSTITWNLKCSYEDLEKNTWIDLETFKKESPDQYQRLKQGVDNLYNNVYSLDQKINQLEVSNPSEVFIPGGSAPQWSNEFFNSYKECFCAVVNETRYAQPFGYFSEKTLTALMMGLPIILVAPPYTLEYLKTFGIKTFDKWWDESYDREENHYQRIKKIFNLIDFINSKSMEELKVMYDEMKDIIEHNQSMIKQIPLNDKIL